MTPDEIHLSKLLTTQVHYDVGGQAISCKRSLVPDEFILRFGRHAPELTAAELLLVGEQVKKTLCTIFQTRIDGQKTETLATT